AAHVGKYDGIFARLCLLWHCIESNSREVSGPVSASTAERVAKFLHGFLFPHALAFYNTAFGLSDDNDRLMDVAGYILAHEVKVVTRRIIHHGSKSMRKLGARDIESILHQLEALGWVTRIHGRRVNIVQWSVNPEVHELFKERARREAERRRRDRE